ncbi:MAG: type II toxin-antitoxin system Phd/YefM family antitoxin [Candidatus Izemoplasmatales bacterium]
MIITSNRIVSVTEANQNFNKVAKTAEKYGDTVIFRRNKPAFILMDIETMGEEFVNEYEKMKLKYLSDQLLCEYEVAYKTLAK